MQYRKPAEEKQMKAALIGAGEESLHTIQDVYKRQALGRFPYRRRAAKLPLFRRKTAVGEGLW